MRLTQATVNGQIVWRIYIFQELQAVFNTYELAKEYYDWKNQLLGND
jgi:hypothetical protein